MRYFLGFLSTVLFLNCSSLDKNLSPFNKLEIETLVADSLMNIRALELTQKNVVAVSSLGDVYRYNLEKQSLVKSRFSKDTFNIRSIALVDGVLFSLSIGNPAVLYRDSVLVYFEKHPSVFYDFFATMADIVDSPLPYPTDGISYLPTLIGEKQIKHDYLYWEFPEKQYKGQQAIRTDNWKGIKKNLLKGKSKLQLFNLEDDPKEMNDLAENYPEVVDKLENLMEKAHTKAALEKFNIPILD